jgi:arylsulfatase A-like enzyme
MTGKHPGHAWIRDNREVQPEGQPPLPAGTITIAKLLKKKGYATAAMGKWGLGFPGSEGDPLKQGFDRFFGYNCQRHAHNYYPTSLWDNDRRLPLNNARFAAHQKFPSNAEPANASVYDAYTGKDYAPDLIREQALRFIRENRERPFFLYYATTVPHLALQVPEDSLAEYEGKWPEEPYLGERGYLPHRTPRAAYAAMVTRLDRDVGKLWALVKELGLDDQTMIVFTSDNGPLYNRWGGTDTDFFNSAGILRGRKGSLYEGGIRVPLIAHWPGRIPTGTTSDRVTGFEDWLPTVLDLTGMPNLDPRALDGISFAPTLQGRSQPPRPFLYREFPGYGGWQMVRVGDWKAVRVMGTRGNARKTAVAPLPTTELYNLREDPGEKHNQAATQREMLGRLEIIMREQHQRSELFPLWPLDRANPLR